MQLLEVVHLVEEIVDKDDFWQNEKNVSSLQEMLRMMLHAKRPVIYV